MSIYIWLSVKEKDLYMFLIIFWIFPLALKWLSVSEHTYLQYRYGLYSHEIKCRLWATLLSNFHVTLQNKEQVPEIIKNKHDIGNKIKCMPMCIPQRKFSQRIHWLSTEENLHFYSNFFIICSFTIMVSFVMWF